MNRRFLLHIRRATALVLIPTFVLAPSAPALCKEKKEKKSESPKPADLNAYPPVLIGPGDLLVISVYGENTRSLSGNDNQLPTDYQVDSNGVITFPFLGNVVVSGMTPAEASAKLAKLLAKPRKVTVLIKESNTYWVSVLGNVGKPGKYQIRGKPTLLSALAEAGGPLPGSDMGGAILLHHSVKSKVDLDKFLKDTGRLEQPEPYMYAGDVLMVQKSGWPSIGEMAIAASILASLAVVTVQLANLKK